MSHSIYKIWSSLVLAVVCMQVESQGLRLTPGAHLVISGAPQLVLQDAGLVNDGEVRADSSRWLFTGNTSFIGGSHSISFYDLVIGGDVQLNNHVSVADSIVMQGGNLRLNRYTLDLGRSGSIMGERNESRITGGLIKVSALLDAPVEVNPGNIGLSLTSSANLGWTTIVRGHEQQTDAGIGRYFIIDPERNAPAPVSLRMFYFEGELSGKNKEMLGVLARGAMSGGWIGWGKDQADANAGWVAKKNIGGGQFVTLGISANRLRAVQIAPNPTSGQFRVTLVCEKEEDKVICLYDALGHLLLSRRVHCIGGSNSIEWNGTGLEQGVYRLGVEGMDPVMVEIMR
ncbi:MAG: hypothetical protein J0H74_27255 [Chitinophagaceae bacterium]|nr:hypothetical protein [Chitinophagaceae bacterium]